MDELNGARLLADWGGVNSPPDSSSRAGSTGLRCGALRQPWQVRQTEPATSDEGLDPDAPDFGIRFARRFVAACRRGVIPRRRKRGLLRQHRVGLKWLRHGIRYLERKREGLAGGVGDLSPPQRVVERAIGLDHDATRRGLLQRLLVAHGAEVTKVAQVLRLDAAAVEAYQALFFDVRNRAENPFRFVAALGAAPARSGGAASGRDLPPLWECASMSFEMALQLCGLAGNGESGEDGESGDAGAVYRFEAAARFVMMKPDRINPESRAVAKALAKYEAMEAELHKEKRVSLHDNFIKPIEALPELPPPAVESGGEGGGSGAGDGVIRDPRQTGSGIQVYDLLTKWRMGDTRHDRKMARQLEEAMEIMRELDAADQAALPDAVEYVPLTAADLRRACDLWQQCQRTPAAQGGFLDPRKPPVLEPLWEKNLSAAVAVDAWERPGGGELPPEMEAPDFGWQLARQVAACGMQAKLPAEDPFLWIRLAAEQPDLVGEAGVGEDPWRRALRLAKDLHERPAARHLLQAALLTREAEIGEVAAFLCLDPRGVAAYATLFFNVPGRGDEEGFKQFVTQRYASDCDRLGGDPARSRQGLAELLRRAPGLTLEQLERLLGFNSSSKDPAAAARMLLRYLSALAPARGALRAGDDGESRRPRRAVRARRNSADFEQAVEAAGKWMEARHFGAVALMSGLGDALGDTGRDSTKGRKYGFMLQTYIESGLTEEEAVGKLQADKKERRVEKRRQMESQTRKNHG